MNEGKIYVVPKKPMLSREASENYEHHTLMWKVVDNFEERGGSPTIVGVVTVDSSLVSTTVPRYKVQFPDGVIDYFRLDTFDKFYEMKTIREEIKNNNLTMNITINIENKEDIERYVKEVEEKFKEAGRKFGESFKNSIQGR